MKYEYIFMNFMPLTVLKNLNEKLKLDIGSIFYIITILNGFMPFCPFHSMLKSFFDNI